MLNPHQIKTHIIPSALRIIEKDSPQGQALVFGTGLVESRYSYILQRGGGPALSPWQIEPFTLKSQYETYLAFRPSLQKAVDSLRPLGISRQQALIGDLYYGAAMCRIRYLQEPAYIPPHSGKKLFLPDADDLMGQAVYWNDNYNANPREGWPWDYIERAGEHMDFELPETDDIPIAGESPEPERMTDLRQRDPGLFRDRSPKKMHLDRRTWLKVLGALLEANNLPYRSDVRDFWQRAGPDGGDCEDLCLRLRDDLVHRGFNDSSLRLTLGLMPDKRGHAILTWDTDRGTMALDPVYRWAGAWRETSTRLVRRNVPGQSAWEEIGPPALANIVGR